MLLHERDSLLTRRFDFVHGGNHVSLPLTLMTAPDG